MPAYFALTESFIPVFLPLNSVIFATTASSWKSLANIFSFLLLKGQKRSSRGIRLHIFNAFLGQMMMPPPVVGLFQNNPRA
jgi:hypothetical protein